MPKTAGEAKEVATQEMTTAEHMVQKFTSAQVVGLRALLQMAAQESLMVTEVFEQSKVQELGPHEPPVEEFAKIDTLLKSGVTVDELMVIAEAGELPVLAAAETQVALVRLVEDQGFRAIASQVHLHIRSDLLNKSRDNG